MGVQGLFDYEGPAGLLPVLREAFSWVQDPVTGSDILAARRVRRVRVADGAVHVLLALPASALAQVVTEDAEAELFDRLGGGYVVQVSRHEHCGRRCAARSGPPGACAWQDAGRAR